MIVPSPGHLVCSVAWMGRIRRAIVGRPTSSGVKRDDVTPGATLDQGQHVLAPTRERGLHRALVLRSVVDTRDAGPMTTVVIQRGLDHVRFDADVGHAGGNSSAN